MTRWLAVSGRDLLVVEGEGGFALPGPELLPGAGASADAALDAGFPDGEPARVLELDDDFEPPEGARLVDLRALHALVDGPTWRLAGRAVHLVDWRRTSRHCGRCGSPTEPHDRELATACPACGLLHFPRIAPAVIVLVERGDAMLLARSPHFPEGLFSTLAGFVEPGESLEETVHREIREETGVEVGHLRYFGSQAWPFPHSLMVGFHATWAGGDIRVDGEEVVEAGWFEAGSLPRLPTRFSIARALIADFLTRRGAPVPEE